MISFTQERKFKSIALGLDDLRLLLGKLQEVVREDNKGNRLYKRNFECSVSYPGRVGFATDDKDEFVEFLKSNKEGRISDFEIWYFGRDVDFRFTSLGWLGPVLKIKATKKGNLMGLEDDFCRILEKDSLNWVFNNMLFRFVLPILLLIGFLGVLIRTTPSLIRGNFELFAGIFIAIMFFFQLLTTMLGYLYPTFLIKPASFKNGRLLKEDALKLFVAFCVLSLGSYFIPQLWTNLFRL